MNVVDSSAWLAYFADEANAQQRSEGVALQYVAVMQQGRVVGLDASLALLAALLGARHKLPLADSIIYATAQQANALV